MLLRVFCLPFVLVQKSLCDSGIMEDKYFGTKDVPAVSMNLPEKKTFYIVVPETLFYYTICLIYNYFIKG